MLDQVDREHDVEGALERGTCLEIGLAVVAVWMSSAGHLDGVLGDVRSAQGARPGEGVQQPPVAATDIHDRTLGQGLCRCRSGRAHEKSNRVMKAKFEVRTLREFP
jgi:hypothetical protein